MLSLMTAHEISSKVAAQEVSAETIIGQALKKAQEVQNKFNAFISIDDNAINKAKELDKRIAAGENVGKLAGVPVVIKDNICTKDLRTTAGSKILETFIPPYNATVVERLEAAGAIVIAKANLDEFGMGSSNENSAYGIAKNPWDSSRVPGGSSGGSAIAVATGVVPFALGTDTGGSVRQPASFTGTIGFKPTYGQLSRYGVVAYASSLDQVGVIAQNSSDLALAMDAMSGHDANDSTNIKDSRIAFVKDLQAKKDLSGIKIGLIKELCGEGNSDDVLDMLEQTQSQLEKLGASVKTVSLENVRYGIASYYLVAPAEASSNLARYDGMIYSNRVGKNSEGQVEIMMKTRGKLFGPEVRKRILMGSYALSAGYYDAFYGKALKVRKLIANDFAKAFESFDFLMTPTTPSVAYKIGEKTNDPLAMYLDDIDTVLANLVGIPAISLPMGQSKDNLPIGIQFFAPALKDESLLQLTNVIENSQDNFAPTAKY